MLKQNKSGGLDGLKHFVYGGEQLKLWLNKVLNCILVLEDTPQGMKDGVVISFYKWQGEIHYYQLAIEESLSLIEIIILYRLSLILKIAGSLICYRLHTKHILYGCSLWYPRSTIYTLS